MTYIPVSVRDAVIQRAHYCCEYGLIHADYTVIPQKHGGRGEVSNRAYSCAQYNRCKGSTLAAIDPALGEIVPLGDPGPGSGAA